MNVHLSPADAGYKHHSGLYPALAYGFAWGFMLSPSSTAENQAKRVRNLASRPSPVTESARRQRIASHPNGAFLLLSVSRPANTARTSIARIILAAMLMLVVLAGAVPFSSLSSSHECGMACCIGKPSHMAGSCSVELGNEEQAETPAEPSGEQTAHSDHAMHLSGEDSPEAVASTEHQEAAKHPVTHHSKSGAEESTRTVSIASQAITTPCSTECAAAASASTQVRRPRDPASVSVSERPRPPTTYLLAGCFTVPSPKSAEGRRLSRPRAPPFLLNNLPSLINAQEYALAAPSSILPSGVRESSVFVSLESSLQAVSAKYAEA